MHGGATAWLIYIIFGHVQIFPKLSSVQNFMLIGLGFRECRGSNIDVSHSEALRPLAQWLALLRCHVIKRTGY